MKPPLSAPQLRRAKSLQTKSPVHSDSDELSDSDGSEEEYIPTTSEDDSDCTDTHKVIDLFSQPKKPLKGLKSRKMDNVKDGCLSSTEKNNGSSKPAVDRGRSSSKESGSGMKRKRQSSRGSADGASFPQEAEASLYIPAVCKKDNGSRMYIKRHYCLYCQIGVGKIARHLERHHLDEPDVAQAMSFPKGSKQRRLSLEQLRNRGNFTHNVDVLNTGVGDLVPRQQPKQDSQAQSFLHCVHCQGLFGKRLIWKHMANCKFNPASEKPYKTRPQAQCAFAVPPPPGVKVEFWKLLSSMNLNEVYDVLKSDACILEFGEHLCERLGYDGGQNGYIRQKLRELGRLLICSRKTTPLKTIQDHVKPENFMHVVRSVKHMAGFDSETNAYKSPSLALKIGHSLTKISELTERRANAQNDRAAAKDARRFRDLYETRWNELVSAASLRTLRGAKRNAPRLLPFTKDVQTLHSYLDAQQQRVQSDLSTKATPQTWTQLVKITLAQILLVNRRRTGPVAKMPLAAYLSPKPPDPHGDVNTSLWGFEKKLCRYFRRIETQGNVPVLLTPAMQRALDLLVSKRQECGVLSGNPYLFARPSALTCYRGSESLLHFARACGAKQPSILTSSKLRKQTATLWQVLSLSDGELRRLADVLGVDMRTHQEFYRLPEGTLPLARLGKVLLALDRGRVSEFKGKTLDDISIGPNETVQMDNNRKAACHSDSHESPSHQREANETTVPDVSRMDAAPLEGQMTSPSASRRDSPKQKKGRRPFQRKMWEEEEILAVEKHMMAFITSRRVPGKRDCDECLQAEKDALKNRTWSALKFYIKNRIAALKRGC